jgi:HD-like signal output (HDOD) protein
MLDFQKLVPLFQDATALPKLPTSALEILDALQNEDTSTEDLERIIMRDPSLMTGLLRVANSALYGGFGQVATVPAAIMRLGMGGVRSLTLSMAITSVTRSASGSFDAEAFARHSIFVGFLGRFLFARRKVVEMFNSKWTGEEVFAAGILHDLPIALLSKLSVSTFNEILSGARANGRTFRTEFEVELGSCLGSLGGLAAKAWNLPSVFVDVVEHIDHPETHATEFLPLTCLSLADSVAAQRGWAFESWATEPKEPTAILLELGLAESDLASGIESVDRHAQAFLGESKAA